MLATAKTPTQPLLAVQRYGQGKSLAILSDSLWRWALTPGEENLHQRFWNRLLDWLTPQQEELAPFEVDLFGAAASVHIGESVRLTARIGGAETDGANVVCEIRTPDGRVLPFRMMPTAVTTAEGRTLPGFEILFAPEAPGPHRACASAEVAARNPRHSNFSCARSVPRARAGRRTTTCCDGWRSRPADTSSRQRNWSRSSRASARTAGRRCASSGARCGTTGRRLRF